MSQSVHRLRGIALVALILIVSGAAAVWYYDGIQTRERTHLEHRALRILAMTGEQLGERLDVNESILRSAAGLTTLRDLSAYAQFLENIGARERAQEIEQEREQQERRYLRTLAPHLEWAACDEKPNPRPTPEFIITVGGYNSAVATAGGQARVLKLSLSNLICAEVTLENLVPRLTEGAPSELFDDILLVDGYGRVIFQSAKSEIRIHRFSELLDHPEPTEAAGEEYPAADSETADPGGAVGKSGDIGSFAHLSGLREVEIARKKFMLFSQPIRLISALNQDRAPFQLVLCGLIRSEDFKSEGSLRAIKPLGQWGVSILLIVLLIWPAIHTSVVMGPFSSLRARTPYLMGAGICFAGGVLLAAVLYFVHRGAIDVEARGQLSLVADTIERNLYEELNGTLLTIEALTRDAERDAVSAVREGRADELKVCPEHGPHYFTIRTDCFRERCREYYPSTLAKERPSWDLMFWADRYGHQRVKWTFHKQATAYTPMKDYWFFQESRKGNVWELIKDPERQGPALHDRRFLMAAVHSPTTGEDLAVVTQRISRENDDQILEYAFAAFPLASLFHVVLPSGYGYALIDEAGKVQFHSDPGRNLRENFFREAGNSPELRAAVLAEGETTERSEYYGVPHLIHVRPLQRIVGSSLSLVAFRGSTRDDFFSVQIVFLALAFVLGYVAILLVPLGLIVVGRKLTGKKGLPVPPPSRLWPVAEHRVWFAGLFAASMLVLGITLAPLAGRPFALTSGSAAVAVVLPVILACGFWIFVLLWQGPKWRLPERIVGERMNVNILHWLSISALLLALISAPAVVAYEIAFRHSSAGFSLRDLNELERLESSRQHRLNARYHELDRDIRASLLTLRSDSLLDRPYLGLGGKYSPSYRRILTEEARSSAQVEGFVDSTLRWLARRMPKSVVQVPAAGSRLNSPAVSEVESALEKYQVNSAPAENEDQDAWMVPVAFLVVVPVVLIVTRRALNDLCLEEGYMSQVLGRFVEVWPEIDTSGRLRDLESRTIIIGPAAVGKSEWVRGQAGIARLDLSLRDFENETGEGAGSLVLDNFEAALMEPSRQPKLLEFLEKIVTRDNVSVAIVTAADPVYMLVDDPHSHILWPADGEDETTYRHRWMRVLAGFQRYSFVPAPEKRGILDPRAVLANSSLSERLVLTEIAEEGWVNPRQMLALHHLVDRGLVRRTPRPEIINQELCDYTRQMRQVDDFQKYNWAPDAEGRFLRFGFYVGLLVVLCVVLYYVGRAVQSDFVTLIGPLGALATVAQRIIATYRGKGLVSGELT